MKRDLLITLLQSVDRMHSIDFGTDVLGLFERAEKIAVEQARLLVAGELLTATFCTQCGEKHSCEVRWLGVPGTFGSPFYDCINDPSVGRVFISHDALATFRPSLARLTDFLAQTICPNDRRSTIVPDRLFSLGVLRSHDVQYRIYLGVGCRRKDAAIEVLPKLQTVRNTVILVPTYIPDCALHPSSFFVSLSDMLRIEGEKIVVDIGAILRDAAVSEEPLDLARNVFTREGKFWRVVYEGKEIRLAASKGTEYIARLLADPGVEIPALRFVSNFSVPDNTMVAANIEETFDDFDGQITSFDDSSRELLVDRTALRDAKERKAEVEVKREKALRLGKQNQLARFNEDILAYDRYITSSTNKHGEQRTVIDANEKARKAVSNAIKRTLPEIKEANPDLYAHLNRFITLGRVLSYRPERSLTWTVKF